MTGPIDLDTGSAALIWIAVAETAFVVLELVRMWQDRRERRERELEHLQAQQRAPEARVRRPRRCLPHGQAAAPALTARLRPRDATAAPAVQEAAAPAMR